MCICIIYRSRYIYIYVCVFRIDLLTYLFINSFVYSFIYDFSFVYREREGDIITSTL